MYGRKLADVLASPGEGALVTLFPHHWKDEGAEELECDWTAFFDVLATRRPFRGRMHQPGFTACSFAPSLRVLAHVRAVSAVVLRFGPHDGVSLGGFLTAWADHAGFAFTTAEHSTAAASFVVVLPYTRLVSLDEHRGAIDGMATSAKRDGRPFDPGARNPARFVFLPGAIPGRPFEARPLYGNAFVAPQTAMR